MKAGFLKMIWPRAAAICASSAFLYVFMEWIFFATKPSFLSSMRLTGKLQVFFIASFLLVTAILVLHGLASGLARMTGSNPVLPVLIPAILLATLALILFDNFTYTVLKFGIVDSQGIWRLAYAGGYLGLCFWFTRSIMHRLQKPAVKPVAFLSLALLVVSTGFFLWQILNAQTSLSGGSLRPAPGRSLPDIILLGLDGVNATHMSAYGYERDTTPQIRAWMDRALVAENAFSNAGKTGGSLTSLLTGKLPTQTRVIFPPDILLGQDAYQHLPGMLKQMGYTTIEITMPYYGDAYQRNLADGFDEVNYRAWKTSHLMRELSMLGGAGFYFAGEILNRAGERLGHIFFIRKMVNPYAIVTQTVYATHDDRRFEGMMNYIHTAQQPLFLHVHLMDTHGPVYYVPHQHFSSGQPQDGEWMTDFYDDAILEGDGYVGQLLEELAASGKGENTLVILYSDHGSRWDVLQRVPLMFWFPGGQHAGRISQNVQLLDIAPTILDYLRVQQPAWMQGRSLLSNHLPPGRPIFSADVGAELKVTEDRTTWVVDQAKISPPFYDLGRINMIVCDHWFSLDLRKPGLTSGLMAGSTMTCPDEIPTPAGAEQTLIERLRQDRYDVDELRRSLGY